MSKRLDALFEKTTQRQYTRELLFSTTVDLTALVVCRVWPSINAAYQATMADVGVTKRALYDRPQWLFGFCVVLAANNVSAAVTAVVRATYKKVALDVVLTEFYVAEELAVTKE